MTKKKTAAPDSGAALPTPKAAPKKPATKKSPAVTSAPEVEPIAMVQAAPQLTTTAHTVVIPYLASKATGKELIFALRAWEKQLEGGARIIIIGDLPVELDSAQIGHIPHRPESTNPQIDVAHKMAAAIASDLVPDTFIWSNDDIFPIAPITFEDLAAKKAMDLSLKTRGEVDSVYGANTKNTAAALAKEGIQNPPNYDAHLPVVFQKGKLAETLAKFNCLKEGHLVATLYFNQHYPLARPFVTGNSVEGTLLASVWSANPNREILKKVFEYKQFINCNDAGYPFVEPYLIKLFPKKSKFEK